MGRFLILKFPKTTFQTLSIFSPIFKYNDVIRLFCDLDLSILYFRITLQTYLQSLNRMWRHHNKNTAIFWNYGSDIIMTTSSTQN